mmetsp:Transcript_33615/g.97838  ORF Transcript_33615/g.97838 Transcript_33615/m.97838 type:complete len:209 (+) Transcript_33615:67-693(+)
MEASAPRSRSKKLPLHKAAAAWFMINSKKHRSSGPKGPPEGRCDASAFPDMWLALAGAMAPPSPTPPAPASASAAPAAPEALAEVLFMRQATPTMPQRLARMGTHSALSGVFTPMVASRPQCSKPVRTVVGSVITADVPVVATCPATPQEIGIRISDPLLLEIEYSSWHWRSTRNMAPTSAPIKTLASSSAVRSKLSTPRSVLVNIMH